MPGLEGLLDICLRFFLAQFIDFHQMLEGQVALALHLSKPKMFDHMAAGAQSNHPSQFPNESLLVVMPNLMTFYRMFGAGFSADLTDVVSSITYRASQSVPLSDG